MQLYPFTCKQHISFFFTTEWNSIVYIYHIFLIHSSFVGHLGCIQILAIVNSAVLNMGVQVAVSYSEVHSFEHWNILSK
jgi:hypothetical protein